MMSSSDVSVVLVHGAWADGSSWSKIIRSLVDDGLNVSAPPLPLTSFQDDVAALDRALERVPGPVVLAGHAYAGAVIAATRSDKVRALVYVAALAPDEGETVADVFYRTEPHPQAPKLAPDDHGLIYLPDTAFGAAFAQNGAAQELAVLAAVQRPISPACITVAVPRPLWAQAEPAVWRDAKPRATRGRRPGSGARRWCKSSGFEDQGWRVQAHPALSLAAHPRK